MPAACCLAPCCSKPTQWLDAEELLDELRTRDKNFLIRNRAELLKQRSYYGMSIGPNYYRDQAQVVNKLDALEEPCCARLWIDFCCRWAWSK